MKARRQILTGALGLVALAASTVAASAAVDISSPNLPPIGNDLNGNPTGYLTPQQVHAMYSGPGLVLVLSQAIHQPFADQNLFRETVPGTNNEHEHFDSTLTAMVSANGSPDQPVSLSGPVDTLVLGKAGNTTGTFQTEMLSLNLSGNSPFGPVMIRESPTLQSLGQTSITSTTGGFHIDSFFDIFTELSVDGGQSWIPDSNGPAHVSLQSLSSVPEPGTLAWGAAMGLVFGLRRMRARRA